MWIRFLNWLLEWVLARLKQECYIVPDGFKGWVAMAAELSKQEEDEHPQVGNGEAKRHRVYAQMIKALPEVSKRHIDLSIAVAMNRRKM